MLRRADRSMLAHGFHVERERVLHAQVGREGEALRLLSCAEVESLPGSPGLTRWGVSMGEWVGALHRFALPKADDATTRQLIAAQLEARIPGQADHVRWGWQRSTNGSAVLVYSVARRLIKTIGEAPLGDALSQASHVTAGPMALHHLIMSCSDQAARERSALVALCDRRMHVLCYEHGEIKSLQSIGLRDGVSAESVAEQVVQLVSDAGLDPPLRQFSVVIDGDHGVSVAGLLESRLGAPHRAFGAWVRLLGLKECEASQLMAAGCAIGAMDAGHVIDLGGDAEGAGLRGGTSVVRRPTAGRWALAAVCVLSACGLVFVGDRASSVRVIEALASAGLDAKRAAQLDTDLAVAAYLERSGPGLMTVLDEFSQKTSGFMVDEVRFERDGQFVFRATANSAEEASRVAASLATMKTLRGVQIRNQTANDRDQIEYTIVAQPASAFISAWVEPAVPPTLEPQARDKALPTQGGGS